MLPGIGMPELIIIGAIALMVFGGKRLPELGKSLGKGIRDFKKALETNEEEPKNETAKLDGAKPDESKK